MAEKKETLEFTLDSLKRVQGDQKIAQLMAEINHIKFLPTKFDNSDLDEGINTGNLHNTLQLFMSQIYREYSKELTDPVELEVILPAAIFAVTGIANSNGLSIYAFYRWLTTANLSKPEELPLLIQFAGKSSKNGTERIVHHAFGYHFNLNSEKYHKKKIELPEKPQYRTVDFYLRETHNEVALNKITALFSKIDSEIYLFPVKTNSLDVVAKLQKELPIRFNAACEKLRNAMLAAMNHFPMDAFQTSSDTSNTSHEKVSAEHRVDITVAHDYLRKCYLKRRSRNDLYAGETGINVLANIELIWEFLMQKTRSADFRIFSEESLAVVREMAARVKLAKAENFFDTETVAEEENEYESLNDMRSADKTTRKCGVFNMFRRICCCYRKHPERDHFSRTLKSN